MDRPPVRCRPIVPRWGSRCQERGRQLWIADWGLRICPARATRGAVHRPTPNPPSAIVNPKADKVLRSGRRGFRRVIPITSEFSQRAALGWQRRGQRLYRWRMGNQRPAGACRCHPDSKERFLSSAGQILRYAQDDRSGARINPNACERLLTRCWLGGWVAAAAEDGVERDLIGQSRQVEGDQALLGGVERTLGVEDAQVAVDALVVADLG